MQVLPRQLPSRMLLCVRLLAFVLAGVPLARMIWQAFFGGLGPNPAETLLHQTGEWGLRMLLITLAVTPLRWLTGANWLVRLRRMLGLWAFAYAMLHFLVFIVFEHGLALAAVWEDIVERPYILIGFTAWLILLALAVTSPKAMVRRLGKRWKRLHQAVYLAAPLAILHFFMLTKSDDYRRPAIYAGILLLWLAVRSKGVWTGKTDKSVNTG